LIGVVHEQNVVSHGQTFYQTPNRKTQIIQSIIDQEKQ